MNALRRWLKNMASREQRKIGRQEGLPLIAHFWDGGVPLPHRVRDINERGLYLWTEQRWYPGTLVNLVLQREDQSTSDPNRSISISARVVRSGSDGVGFVFIPLDRPNRHIGEHGLPIGADKKSFQQFLDRLYDDHG